MFGGSEAQATEPPAPQAEQGGPDGADDSGFNDGGDFGAGEF
ncbi:hypothetical protein [Mesorhizobium sp.]|nr:hypothetical protein [Mesorhizobium sp.]